MSDTVAFRYVSPMLLEPIAPFEQEYDQEEWEAGGYEFVDCFGSTRGMYMSVYRKSGEFLWVLVITDNSTICQIEVGGWLPFLELMGRYCPIMLASHLPPSE